MTLKKGHKLFKLQ